MIIKDKSIDISKLQPALLLGLVIIDQTMTKHGGEAVITGGCEGKHSFSSLHYRGDALDIRSKDFTDAEAVLEDCREALGHVPDFDLILEHHYQPNEHFHLEFQPKRRG